MSRFGDVFGKTVEQELERRLQEIDYAMAHRDDEDFVELALVNAHHSLRRVLGKEKEDIDASGNWPA